MECVDEGGGRKGEEGEPHLSLIVCQESTDHVSHHTIPHS